MCMCGGWGSSSNIMSIHQQQQSAPLQQYHATPQVARFDEHVTTVMRTLRCLIALQPSVLFCGHRCSTNVSITPLTLCHIGVNW